MEVGIRSASGVLLARDLPARIVTGLTASLCYTTGQDEGYLAHTGLTRAAYAIYSGRPRLALGGTEWVSSGD